MNAETERLYRKWRTLANKEPSNRPYTPASQEREEKAIRRAKAAYEMNLSREEDEIGKSCYSCIVDMVTALECDYDRREELRDQEDIDDDEREEIANLEGEAGDCKDREDALERIMDDPLEIQVRSDWHSPGASPEAPIEFFILLSTGGPASRIRGEIDQYGEPDRAWLEVQDWGKPWTQYFPADPDTLLTYARCFYFGEG